MSSSHERRGSSKSSDVETDTIVFNEARGRDGFVVKENATKVVINPSPPSPQFDQSRFKLRTYVDYGWDNSYCSGRFISTHINGKFIAYIVKVGAIGAVRVIDLDTKERVLMKAQKGLVKDVEFMHKPSELYVGFVDEYGTFYINKISKEKKSNTLNYTQIIRVTLDQSSANESRRFIWCKYVPEDNLEVATPKDCAYHFAVLQNDCIYVGNLVQIAQSVGEGAHSLSEVRSDMILIDTHSAAVTDASFAPDGTAIATASRDGTVKFFQVYFRDSNPGRCLFSWAPHEGKPVDKIFFLDNHTVKSTTDSAAQYWKFMLTAADNMTEIKLFTCRTWECLQTIKFNSMSQWRLELDITAEFLVATDTHEKAVYVLRFQHGEDTARALWIQEFTMPCSVLSFNVSLSTRMPLKSIIEKGYEDFVIGNPDSFARDDEMTLVELNFVQPKSLQQGTIVFKAPTQTTRPNSHGRISFNESISYNETEDDDVGEEVTQANLSIANEQLNLSSKSITALKISNDNKPSSNSKTSLSPSKRRSSPSPDDNPLVAQMSQQLSSLIGLSSKPNAESKVKSPRLINSQDSDTENPVRPSTNGNTNKGSGSSSPSREVEEILSPKLDMRSHRSDLSTTNADTLLMLNAVQELENINNGNVIQSSSTSNFDSHKLNNNNETNTKTVVPGSDLLPQLPHVLQKVGSLVSMMEAQATQIQDLKKEIARLNVNATSKPNNDAVIHQVLETHFATTQHQINRIEEAIAASHTHQESKVPQIPSNLADVLAASVGTVVKKEISNVVPITLSNLYEPGRLNVNAQIDRLTTVVESRLSQNIAKVLMDKNIWESVTSHFKAITQNVVETTFHETFLTKVLPNVQSAIHEMLRQVNEAFMKGTREYLTGLEDALEQDRKNGDSQAVITAHMNKLQETLSNALQGELEAQMSRVVNGLQGGIVKHLEESFTRELNRAFKEQQRFLEVSQIPRYATPAVSSDHLALGTDPVAFRKSLSELVKNGDISTAFMQACSYGDLSNLMYLCKQVSPTVVFGSKQLSTQTHIAILQMLVTDLMTDTELKINYIQTAVGCLDFKDPKIVQNFTRLVPILQASSGRYCKANPNSRLSFSLKILDMAVAGTLANLQE